MSSSLTFLAGICIEPQRLTGYQSAFCPSRSLHRVPNETLDQAWSGMRADSPTKMLTICDADAERAIEVPHVLQQLSLAES